jgi:tetratricopeptide (TPR) repeat protein
MDASYAVLSADTARLYRRLGRLPLAAFDTPTAAAACAESPRWAGARLDELLEANLVEDIGPDSYRFHDLVRAHARGTADDTGAQPDEALRRVCDWYLHTATAAEQRLTPAQFVLPRTYADLPDLPEPFRDDAGALAWLDAHRTDLMALMKTAADRGWHATAWQLADAMWPLFLRLRHYDLWIAAHETGLSAARRDANAEAERQMLNSGAIGLRAAGRLQDATAWYETSLRAARAAGDVRDEGQALLGLGSCHRQAGRPDAAVPCLNRAITVWEACGYPRGAALARTTLGEIALAADATDDAAAHFSRARDELLAVNDTHDAARALAFLGRANARAGLHPTGTARMEEALAVFASSGAVHWQARTLEMLGESAHERGDHPASQDLLARAVALYEITSTADARRLERLLDTDAPPEGPVTEGPAKEPSPQ